MRNVQRQIIVPIAERYTLDLVVLFGSTARGRTHARSDLDVAVRGNVRLDPYREAEIREALCAAFGRSDVEVRDIRALPPSLLRAIARDGVVLFERTQGAFAAFQVYGVMRYAEAAPLRRLRRARLHHRLGV